MADVKYISRVYLYPKGLPFSIMEDNRPNFNAEDDRKSFIKTFCGIPTIHDGYELNYLSFENATMVIDSKLIKDQINFLRTTIIRVLEDGTTEEVIPNNEKYWRIVNIKSPIFLENQDRPNQITVTLKLDYWMTYWPVANKGSVRCYVEQRHCNRYTEYDSEIALPNYRFNNDTQDESNWDYTNWKLMYSANESFLNNFKNIWKTGTFLHDINAKNIQTATILTLNYGNPLKLVQDKGGEDDEGGVDVYYDVNINSIPTYKDNPDSVSSKYQYKTPYQILPFWSCILFENYDFKASYTGYSSINLINPENRIKVNSYAYNDDDNTKSGFIDVFGSGVETDNDNKNVDLLVSPYLLNRTLIFYNSKILTLAGWCSYYNKYGKEAKANRGYTQPYWTDIISTSFDKTPTSTYLDVLPICGQWTDFWKSEDPSEGSYVSFSSIEWPKYCSILEGAINQSKEIAKKNKWYHNPFLFTKLFYNDSTYPPKLPDSLTRSGKSEFPQPNNWDIPAIPTSFVTSLWNEYIFQNPTVCTIPFSIGADTSSPWTGHRIIEYYNMFIKSTSRKDSNPISSVQYSWWREPKIWKTKFTIKFSFLNDKTSGVYYIDLLPISHFLYYVGRTDNQNCEINLVVQTYLTGAKSITYAHIENYFTNLILGSGTSPFGINRSETNMIEGDFNYYTILEGVYDMMTLTSSSVNYMLTHKNQINTSYGLADNNIANAKLRQKKAHTDEKFSIASAFFSIFSAMGSASKSATDGDESELGAMSDIGGTATNAGRSIYDSKMNAKMSDLSEKKSELQKHMITSSLSDLTASSDEPNVRNEEDIYTSSLLNFYAYPKLMIYSLSPYDMEKLSWLYHKFGYTVNRLMYVAFNSENKLWGTRTVFNYWKIDNFVTTINTGKINELIVLHFQSIFKKGIRLWNNEHKNSWNNFKNYNLDNYEKSLQKHYEK